MDFQTFYLKLLPSVKSIAKSYSGNGVFIGEEDLCQEMAIYLWDNFKDGRPANITWAYIIQGCKFHIFNYLRKKREKGMMVSLEKSIYEEGFSLADVLAASGEPLDRCIDRKLTFEQINNNGFSQRQKEVLLLLSQGLTVREVGKRLGISHVMVLKYKRRLIEKWQKVTKEDHFLLK